MNVKYKILMYSDSREEWYQYGVCDSLARAKETADKLNHYRIVKVSEITELIEHKIKL